MTPDRTLYLDGRQAIHVMRDGPALRVRLPDCADQLYPVRLLSSVVASGCVRWETPALLACAEAGLTVSFVSGDGKPLAQLLPAERARGVVDVTDVIERLLARPEGKRRYRAWIEAKAVREWRKLVQENRVPARFKRVTSDTVYESLFKAACKHLPRRLVGRFDAAMVGLLRDRTTLLLRAGGVDLGSEILAAARVAPARDFASVLWWPLLQRRVAFLRRAGSGDPNLAATGRCALRLAVEFIELERAWLDDAFEQLRVEWFSWMLEELHGHAGQ